MLSDKGYARPPLTGRWRNGTVVCIASGPSLTADDCERVRIWREEATRTEEKRAVIVANTSFRIAPWADALFALDRDWWKMYIQEVYTSFNGERYSKNTQNPSYNVTQLKEINTYGNSGAGCISMAAQGGAKNVILLGFDAQHTGGISHWHGDHPVGLGNAGLTNKWLENYKKMANDYNWLSIVNCSRQTAIDCFPRAKLEDVL